MRFGLQIYTKEVKCIIALARKISDIFHLFYFATKTYPKTVFLEQRLKPMIKDQNPTILGTQIEGGEPKGSVCVVKVISCIPRRVFSESYANKKN